MMVNDEVIGNTKVGCKTVTEPNTSIFTIRARYRCCDLELPIHI